MYKNRHFCQHRYFKTIKSRVPRLLNGYCLEKYKIRKNILHHKIHSNSVNCHLLRKIIIADGDLPSGVDERRLEKNYDTLLWPKNVNLRKFDMERNE